MKPGMTRDELFKQLDGHTKGSAGIVGLFGKADFFNGRSALWHYSWTGFLERPIIGWGWRAAWSMR